MAATKKTPAKSASAKASVAKAEKPVAEPVGAAQSANDPAKAMRVKGPTMKIKDLVERVTAATGGKKKEVKEIVEATLAALGDGLEKGEELNLPGLGRARVARAAEKDGASMMTLKVRRGAHKKKDAKEPLAEDEDDS